MTNWVLPAVIIWFVVWKTVPENDFQEKNMNFIKKTWWYIIQALIVSKDSNQILFRIQSLLHLLFVTFLTFQHFQNDMARAGFKAVQACHQLSRTSNHRLNVHDCVATYTTSSYVLSMRFKGKFSTDQWKASSCFMIKMVQWRKSVIPTEKWIKTRSWQN